MSIMPWYSGFLLLLVISGGMGTAFMALSTTLIQDIITDVVRGRVMSLREIFFGLGPVLGLIIGAVAEKTGVSLSLAFLGMVCFLIPFTVMVTAPKLRKLE